MKGQKPKNATTAEKLMACCLVPVKGFFAIADIIEDKLYLFDRAIRTVSYSGSFARFANMPEMSTKSGIGLITISNADFGARGFMQVINRMLRLLSSPKGFEKSWGHTALYVRVNGRVTFSVGFGADGLTLFSQDSVRGGTCHAARVYDNDFMWDLPGAEITEFTVDAQTALAAEAQLKSILESYTASGTFANIQTKAVAKHYYTTNPNEKSETIYKNCVLWAFESLEDLLQCKLVSRQLYRSYGKVLPLEKPLKLKKPLSEEEDFKQHDIKFSEPKHCVSTLPRSQLVRPVDIGRRPNRQSNPIITPNKSSQGRLMREINYLCVIDNRLQNVFVVEENQRLFIQPPTHSSAGQSARYPKSLRLIRTGTNVLCIATMCYVTYSEWDNLFKPGIEADSYHHQLGLGNMISYEHFSSLCTYGARGILGYNGVRFLQNLYNLEFESAFRRLEYTPTVCLALYNPSKAQMVVKYVVAVKHVPRIAANILYNAYKWGISWFKKSKTQ